jgi:tetratricopeptide (TPR) repeat protein
MGRLSKALMGFVGLPLAGLLYGTAYAALPTPGNLAVEQGTGGLSLHWSPVEGAGLYRVAVFDAPEKDGKRPLLAAVWVKGNQYLYGQTATVPKAGKFPSTQPLPLPSGHRLRAMVAAAAGDGTDKGEWAGVDVDIQAAALAPARGLPTAVPTAALTPKPASVPASKEAELEVQGSEEFKQSPDAAVLEIDESAPEAGAGESGAPVQGAAALLASAGSAAGGAAGAAGATANNAVPTDSAKSAPAGPVGSAGEAKALLDAGRFEQAETAYRAILANDPTNADAWEGLGDSYAGRRMKLEAKESYEKALELNKSKTHLKTWIEKNVRR